MSSQHLVNDDLVGVSKPTQVTEAVSGVCMQDGGYHVPFAHKSLAAGLQLDSYTSKLYDKLSIQFCDALQSAAAQDKRIGTVLPTCQVLLGFGDCHASQKLRHDVRQCSLVHL